MNKKTAILSLILVSVVAVSTTSILLSYKAQAALTSASTAKEGMQLILSLDTIHKRFK
jgi:hypothetical protein